MKSEYIANCSSTRRPSGDSSRSAWRRRRLLRPRGTIFVYR